MRMDQRKGRRHSPHCLHREPGVTICTCEMEDEVTTDQLPGQTVHDGRHDYVSTYCQHAVASSDLTEAAELHLRCRQTCKVCSAPCACACHRTTELLLELRVPGGDWYPFREFVERCHVPGNVEVRLVDGIEDANKFPVLHLLPHQSSITFEAGSRLRVVVQREGGPHRG